MPETLIASDVLVLNALKVNIVSSEEAGRITITLPSDRLLINPSAAVLSSSSTVSPSSSLYDQ